MSEYESHEEPVAEPGAVSGDTEYDSVVKKSEYLFSKLTETYARAYNFDRSIIGRIFWLIEKLYLFLRLSPSHKTLFRLIVEDAELHSSEYDINYNNMRNRSGRFWMLADVIRYAINHPFSSIRLLTWYRLNRLVKTIFFGDIRTASAWVEERFPFDEEHEQQPSTIPLTESLDDLIVEFPAYDLPTVSIIIPVYNQYRTTISCLQSILENTKNISYEIIVGDDLSTDLTATIGDRVRNIEVVRAKSNGGFVLNCNAAASRARGEFICLLNNDTNVQAGWLDALLDVFNHRSDAGLVGPKFLFEDGSLQEAGGIVWRDASGWNYGRGKSNVAPEYNYLKEADYISGACFLIRRSTWTELGGFDTRYCPAYYEDTDLAFQVRAKGLKVYYQPFSVVVHFEGVSNGTDLGSGLKKFQLVNQEKFRKKWKKELNEFHFKNGENLFSARERSTSKTTVVIIDHYVPFYDKDAGSKSTFKYISMMVEMGINVKFIGANFFPHQPYLSALQAMGVEVLYGEKYARYWKNWFDDNIEHIDVVYFHRPHVTADFIGYFSALKKRPKLIFFGHDLHYLRHQREADVTGDKVLVEHAEGWKQKELEIYKQVDLVYYPSDVEVGFLKSELPELNVKAIPLYHIDYTGGEEYCFGERSGLLFVGGFGHPPNVDAMEWFIDYVFDIVVDAIPSIELHIVGSSPPEAILNYDGGNIKVHGYLSDDELHELYRKVRMVVIPLRFGAGVKGKVLEALAEGVPILTTSIGAEGIPSAETIMTVKDGVAEFASEAILMYRDEDRLLEMTSKYEEYIGKHYSEEAIKNVVASDFICNSECAT